MGSKNIGKFLTIDVILFVILIGLILTIFETKGKLLLLQLMFFGLLLIFSFISLLGVYYNMRWSWIMLTIIFSVIILDELLIYILNVPIGITGIVSFLGLIIGLIISLSNIAPEKSKSDSGKSSDEKLVDIEKLEKPTIRSKYVASKTGKNYHVSSCPIAKNISKDNMLYLENKEDAINKGYIPHNCIN